MGDSVFDAAVAVVLNHEGGYLEDPQTGEVSNFGLTAKFLRSIGLPDDRDSIRNLTQEQAIEIYRVHWWRSTASSASEISAWPPSSSTWR